jgi:hypothetical protein
LDWQDADMLYPLLLSVLHQASVCGESLEDWLTNEGNKMQESEFETKRLSTLNATIGTLKLYVSAVEERFPSVATIVNEITAAYPNLLEVAQRPCEDNGNVQRKDVV